MAKKRNSKTKSNQVAKAVVHNPLNRVMHYTLVIFYSLLSLTLLVGIYAQQTDSLNFIGLDLSGRLIVRSLGFFAATAIIIYTFKKIDIYKESHTKAALLLMLLIYALDVWGNLFKLYHTGFIWNYDKWVHTLGGIFGTAALVLMTHNYLPKINRYFSAIFAVLLLSTLAGYFEAYEFLSDKYWGTDMIHDLDDTVWDLIVAYGGSMGVYLGYVIYLLARKKK